MPYTEMYCLTVKYSIKDNNEDRNLKSTLLPVYQKSYEYSKVFFLKITNGTHFVHCHTTLSSAFSNFYDCPTEYFTLNLAKMNLFSLIINE